MIIPCFRHSNYDTSFINARYVNAVSDCLEYGKDGDLVKELGKHGYDVLISGQSTACGVTSTVAERMGDKFVAVVDDKGQPLKAFTETEKPYNSLKTLIKKMKQLLNGKFNEFNSANIQERTFLGYIDPLKQIKFLEKQIRK